MNKLTREEIQALSDDELDCWLLYCKSKEHYDCLIKRYKSIQFQSLPEQIKTINCANENFPSFANSLDAQFELAEKFDLYYVSVRYLTDKTYQFVVALKGETEPLEAFAETKRTGAELLLEAIQELEEVK